MKVLLISDSVTDKSGACLSVSIGHLSDPDEIPGLAVSNCILHPYLNSLPTEFPFLFHSTFANICYSLELKNTQTRTTIALFYQTMVDHLMLRLIPTARSN